MGGRERSGPERSCRTELFALCREQLLLSRRTDETCWTGDIATAEPKLAHRNVTTMKPKVKFTVTLNFLGLLAFFLSALNEPEERRHEEVRHYCRRRSNGHG